jgi:hypothetical protein
VRNRHPVLRCPHTPRLAERRGCNDKPFSPIPTTIHSTQQGHPHPKSAPFYENCSGFAIDRHRQFLASMMSPAKVTPRPAT